MGLYDIAAEYAAAQARNEAEAFEYAMNRAFKPGKDDIVSDTDMLYMASLQKHNEELEAHVAELEEKHHNECGQIAHYSDELRRAKELLKEAVKLIPHMKFYGRHYCKPCVHWNLEDRCKGIENPLCKECWNNFKWVHEAEALALIVEDGELNG
ncbi:MAG: hypothetical protein IKO47_08710 [Ruminococcus sp.]|nr:hypothetical protein [Ruminococcus sp.]